MAISRLSNGLGWCTVYLCRYFLNVCNCSGNAVFWIFSQIICYLDYPLWGQSGVKVGMDGYLLYWEEDCAGFF